MTARLTWRLTALLALAALASACAPADLSDPAVRSRAEEVVAMILDGTLPTSVEESSDLVTLPREFADLSATGQVEVSRPPWTDSWFVAFFISADSLIVPNKIRRFVYSENGQFSALVPSAWDIVRLDDNWFLVTRLDVDA